MTTRLKKRWAGCRRAAWEAIVDGAKSVDLGQDLGPDRLAGGLEVAHLAGEDPQPLDRVLAPDRQRRHHRRDPVAERAVLLLGADADRDQGPHLQALGVVAAGPQVLADAAGDDREDDVVDGAAVLVFDPLQLGQVGLGDREAAMGPDLDVEGRVGARPCRRRAPSRWRRRRAGPGAGRAEPRGRRGTISLRAGQALPPGVAEQLQVGRFGTGEPGRAGAGEPCGSASRSKRTVVMSTPETPSTSAWWLLPTIAKRSSRRPSTSHSSQSGLLRSSCWEKIARREVAQLLLGAGRRQGALAHVVVEVEVRVVDPDRPPLVEGDEAQLLAEARNQVQARGDVVAELAVGGRRALEDDRRGDVHVGAGALHVKERGIESGQSFGSHGSSSHRPGGHERGHILALLEPFALFLPDRRGVSAVTWRSVSASYGVRSQNDRTHLPSPLAPARRGTGDPNATATSPWPGRIGRRAARSERRHRAGTREPVS